MQVRIPYYIPAVLRAVVAVVAVAVVVGCGGSEARGDVERAERLLREQPEEALSIVESVDPDADFSDAERARYRLVYSEALYHNYIDVESDSLTRPMADYYLASDDHELRARALYQHALVLQRMGSLAEAMIMFLEAEESLAAEPDNRLLALVYRSMGDIYADGCLFANAMDSYVEAHRLFVAEELDYHAASMLYDMGGIYIQLRDFERASEALADAKAYALECGPREFLCGVLHEQLDLAVYVEDYPLLEATLEAFAEYDALVFGLSHYTAACAILESWGGDVELALSLVDDAEAMEGVEWADLEYARYIIYRNSGNALEALIWQELSKHAQDQLMLEVLEQPVLNLEIEMLRGELEAEEREQELLRQRNIVATIAAIVVAIGVGIYVALRIRRKNRAIQQYVATIGELENSLHAAPQRLSESVAELYADRFTELNELCDTYYDHSGSSRHKSMVFNKLEATIRSIEQDAKRLAELELRVNTYRNDLMAKLRREMPRLSERDTRIALYVFAGFSTRAIAIFIASDPVSVSKMKYNIRRKIQSADIPSGEELARALV